MSMVFRVKLEVSAVKTDRVFFTGEKPTLYDGFISVLSVLLHHDPKKKSDFSILSF